MKLISIQKKPPFYRELLMVFIISLYGDKLYQLRNLMVRFKLISKPKTGSLKISIPYGAIIFTKIQKYFYKTNGI